MTPTSRHHARAGLDRPGGTPGQVGRKPDLTSRRRGPGRWRRARPGVLLALGGVSLYLLFPSLLAVFGSWRSLSHLDWRFALLTLVAEIASFVCLWQLDRIALRTRRWFPVIAAQLSGNLAGRIFPGAGATSTAFSASMLQRAGIATGGAAAALASSSLLQVGTALALPVLALPAILGGAPMSHGLRTAAYLGAAAFILLVAMGMATFATDTPLELAGRATEWLLNATIRRQEPVTNVVQTLVAQRDFVRSTLGAGWKPALAAAVGNAGLDYLALLCALRAVGADPQPSLILLAFATAEVIALIPVTPGGLGLVEAGLVGTLTLAGVPAHDALAATLLYRIVEYWLPLPAGGAAYLLFRRRYGG